MLVVLVVMVVMMVKMLVREMIYFKFGGFGDRLIDISYCTHQAEGSFCTLKQLIRYCRWIL